MKALSYSSAVIFSLIGLINTSTAQTTLPKYEAGLRLSALAYQGDLSPSVVGSYKTPTLGFGAFVTKNLNRSFSIRANLGYAKLRGDDAAYSKPDWRQERNFNFK